MKVLVATGSGNRNLIRNVNRAVDGEMVWIYRNDEPCAECGHPWAVSGLASGKVAPRFTVVDRPDMTPEDYTDIMCDAWLRRGLPRFTGWRDRMVAWLSAQLEVALSFDEGVELSFRGGRLHQTVPSRGNSVVRLGSPLPAARADK